jgi:2-C-methyl-D-erythritol 4-phosphate cytidylyltransferase
MKVVDSATFFWHLTILMKRTIIITAGGIGKRMGAEVPKQFLALNNRPVLFHTIEKFYQFDNQAQLILTLPNEWREYWIELCDTHNFEIPHDIVDGGKERFHSIQHALSIAHGEWIAVHDGVRPLVSQQTIQHCFQAALEHGNAIPVVSVKESLRKIENNHSEAVNRSAYKMVQTPQVFKASQLKEAYKQPFHDGITDDASLVETLGYSIFLVPGSESNIKLTNPMDLQLAALLLQAEATH